MSPTLNFDSRREICSFCLARERDSLLNFNLGNIHTIVVLLSNVFSMPRKIKIFSWYGRPQFQSVKKGSCRSTYNSEHLPPIAEPVGGVRSGATTPENPNRSRANTRPTTPINSEETGTSNPTSMIKKNIGHMAHLITHPMELIHGEQQQPGSSPTTPRMKAQASTSHMIDLLDHHRHIEDMSSMHRRLRDEAQADMDAWLAEGGMKTIVSITQSENLEKTIDANFHFCITIVYDEDD